MQTCILRLDYNARMFPIPCLYLERLQEHAFVASDSVYLNFLCKIKAS